MSKPRKFDRPRYELLVDGKWQGGSFADEAEAKSAAAKVRKSADQKIEVRQKGAPAAAAPSDAKPRK